MIIAILKSDLQSGNPVIIVIVITEKNFTLSFRNTFVSIQALQKYLKTFTPSILFVEKKITKKLFNENEAFILLAVEPVV